jgi:tetratricopeptide (TPR) repeat protein
VTRENLTRAAALYEQSTRTKPDDLHAYTDAAAIREALGEFQQAAALWSDVARLWPDLAVARHQAHRLQLLGDLEGAVGFERARVLRGLALDLRRIGEPEQALALLREAADLAPDEAALWLEYADAALECARYVDALTAAERTLALKPETPRALDIVDQFGGLVQPILD